MINLNQLQNMLKPSQRSLSPQGHTRIWVFCDGGAGGVLDVTPDENDNSAIGGRTVSKNRRRTEAGLTVQAGCGAVARSDNGQILEWSWQPLPHMTNNEAEYAGLLLGAKLATRLPAHEVIFVMDSKTVVGQMRGRYRINSANLRKWHRQACQAIRPFPQVDFRLVARELNCMADALARQARLPWDEVRAMME